MLVISNLAPAPRSRCGYRLGELVDSLVEKITHTVVHSEPDGNGSSAAIIHPPHSWVEGSIYYNSDQRGGVGLSLWSGSVHVIGFFLRLNARVSALQ